MLRKLNLAKRVFLYGFHNQKGNIIAKVIGGLALLIALGAAIPALWPELASNAASIAALTQTDAGTVTLKGFWPVAGIVIGIGVGLAAIFFVLKKFGVMGNG